MGLAKQASPFLNCPCVRKCTEISTEHANRKTDRGSAGVRSVKQISGGLHNKI